MQLQIDIFTMLTNLQILQKIGEKLNYSFGNVVKNLIEIK